jgi:hypothetical protein
VVSFAGLEPVNAAGLRTLGCTSRSSSGCGWGPRSARTRPGNSPRSWPGWSPGATLDRGSGRAAPRRDGRCCSGRSTPPRRWGRSRARVQLRACPPARVLRPGRCWSSCPRPPRCWPGPRGSTYVVQWTRGLRRVYGHAKQGRGVRAHQGRWLSGAAARAVPAGRHDLHRQPPPRWSPATRLRGGTAGSARGAASLVAEALGTAEAIGAGPRETARHAQLLRGAGTPRSTPAP